MGGDRSHMSENIVLVTVDCLRADHCGYVDPEHDRGITPTLDLMAREGVGFRNAVAPGPRTPSSAPVFSSGAFYQYRGQAEQDWLARRARLAEHLDRHGTIAERLSERGYSTASVTANPWTSVDTGFDSGFDRFVEIGASDRSYSESSLINGIDSVLRRLNRESAFNWETKREWFAQWPGVYQEIQTTLEELSEPYFLWVFILDSHQPCITPRRYREEVSAPEMYYSVLRYWHRRNEPLPNHAERSIRRAYRDSVRSVDAFLNTLLDDSHNDPTVIVHADHGEAHGEHGTYGHERQLYEENIRVPLVVYGGDTSETVSEQVSLKRLPEIVLDSADGVLTPEQYTTNICLSKTEFGRVKAVRGHGWKYITTPNTEELYELTTDPEEQHNVVSDVPDVTDLFRDRLDRHETTNREKQRIVNHISRIV